MKKEIADELVTALRSGDYPQARSQLRTPDGYCCLGVLCDIAYNEEVIDGWMEHVNPNDGLTRYRIAGESGILPDSVQQWAGMKTDNGGYYLDNDDPEEEMANCLAQDNDGGKTFAEIADFIEKRYMDL